MRSGRHEISFLDDHVRTGRLAGAVSVAVTRSGIRSIACHGLRDVAARYAIEHDTIFRLHSMSKPLTALGLLSLCDEGRCALDTRAGELVPALAGLSPSLTLRHLLTHTAGLPYPDAAGGPAERSLALAIGDMMTDPHRLSLAEWTERLGQCQLKHAPGADFTYGISIDLVGRIIEVIAEMPLDAFLYERIFAPLGMVDTGFRLSAAQRARVAHVYRATGTGDFASVPAAVEEPRFLSGGGGLYSTAHDYARFCQLLLSDGLLDGMRLIRPEMVDAIASCQLGELRARPAIRTHRDLGPGASFGLLGRVVCEPEISGYGARGTFGWDGVCGNTFFVDRAAGLAGILLTQILPWPENLHRDFRRSVYALEASSAP